MACAGVSKLAGVDASQDEVSRLVGETIPLGRVGAKWDIAIAAVFLCSDAARHVTGPPVPAGSAGCIASSLSVATKMTNMLLHQACKNFPDFLSSA